MQIEVRIESPYGTKLGSGPITTALNWRNSPPLDGMGSFSFEMALSDPQLSLVVKKRYARCYGLLGGTWQELGKAGIIDHIETVIEPGQEPLLRVSGGDLLRELTYRQVGALELVETEAAWCKPSRVSFVGAPDWEWKYGKSRHLPKAYDDDTDTDEDVKLIGDLGENNSYIYVGYPRKTSGIYFDLGTKKNNNECNAAIQYYNGDAWVGVGAIDDGTKVGVDTLAQDGAMTFTKPEGHEKMTHDGYDLYWLRLTTSDEADVVEFKEIDVLAEGPTTKGLASVMAFVPGGWSLDTDNGYATTGEAIYTQYRGETVLEALKILGELTGEHFRLGAGRKVVWIRKNPTDNPVACGYRAVPMYGASAEENPLACLIQSLTQSKDSYEQYSRIYPHGSGTYPDQITLEHATDDVPEGYAYSVELNYLKHIATDDDLRIEKKMVWPEVVALGEGGAHDALAANQLLAVAVEYLKRHKDADESYDLVVVGLPGLVNPGETIPVQYWQYVGGVKILDIDATLIILEPTIEITEDGMHTTTLAVSTTDAFPTNNDRYVARLLRQFTRAAFGGCTGPPSSWIGDVDFETEPVELSGAGTGTFWWKGTGGYAWNGDGTIFEALSTSWRYGWSPVGPREKNFVPMTKNGTDTVAVVTAAQEMPAGSYYLIFNEPELVSIAAATAADRYFNCFNLIRHEDATAKIGGIGLLLIPEGGEVAYLTDFLDRLVWCNTNKADLGPYFGNNINAVFDYYHVHAYYIDCWGGACPLDGDDKVTFGHLQSHLVWLHGAVATAYPSILTSSTPVWITETGALEEAIYDSQANVISLFMSPLMSWLEAWGFDTGKVARVAWYVTYWTGTNYGCLLNEDQDELTDVGESWKSRADR